MASREVDVLLIGGGVASAACAEALREGGFAGSILLVGRELDPPYHRPPVSKGHLTGEESVEDTLFHPAAWWGEHDVELLVRTSVTKLDTDARVAVLSTKDEVAYGQALIATGANVRRLPVDGSDLDGIHYLRALRNASQLREDVLAHERVVIVGGSYIGTEVAASLTKLGKRCAIVMQEDVVHERGFGAAAGAYFQGVLEAHGVEVHGGEALARFEGSDGRVERVVCESGLTLDAGAVVLGVGAVPDVMLARGAGLTLAQDGGVECDSALRTSAPGVFAAGDVCSYDSVVHGRRLRVEHWDVAVQQGKAVARAMLAVAGSGSGSGSGAPQPYDVVPYFFSDLADWTGLEYVGPAASWDAEAVRGSLADGDFTTFYLEDGAVVAALTVGRSDDLDHARRLIATRAAVDAAALADESIALSTL